MKCLRRVPYSSALKISLQLRCGAAAHTLQLLGGLGECVAAGGGRRGTTLAEATLRGGAGGARGQAREDKQPASPRPHAPTRSL